MGPITTPFQILLYTSKQHGFQVGKSTFTNLLTCINFIGNVVEKGFQVDIINTYLIGRTCSVKLSFKNNMK